MVHVWDSGNPEVTVSTVVTINVRRNLFTPTFDQDRYQASVSEHDSIGETVVVVSASDRDQPVNIVYFIFISFSYFIA